MLIMQHILVPKRCWSASRTTSPPRSSNRWQAAVCEAAGVEGCSVVAIPRATCRRRQQLIRVLTGIEVPHGARSTDYGVQCFNVGTAYAIHEALDLDQPLISRIVTVAGNVGCLVIT